MLSHIKGATQKGGYRRQLLSPHTETHVVTTRRHGRLWLGSMRSSTSLRLCFSRDIKPSDLESGKEAHTVPAFETTCTKTTSTLNESHHELKRKDARSQQERSCDGHRDTTDADLEGTNEKKVMILLYSVEVTFPRTNRVLFSINRTSR